MMYCGIVTLQMNFRVAVFTPKVNTLSTVFLLHYKWEKNNVKEKLRKRKSETGLEE